MSIQNQITRITNKRNDSFAAVESKGVTVPSGSTIDDLPGLIALIQTGSGGSGGLVYQDENGYVHLSDTGGSAIGIVDTLDTNGGTIRNIYGIDLSNDTVTAANLMQGITAHNAQGQAITGTASSGLALIGSGSYTYSGSATSVLIISVTYTGTPKVILALKDELDTGVGETIGALRVMETGVQTVDDAFTYGACAFKIKQSNDTVTYVAANSNGAACIWLADNNGNYKADGSYMRVSKYGNANLMQPGAYSWYIYG